MKPKIGQVWAFGGPKGRRDRIKRISRAGVGRWKIRAGKFVKADAGPSTALWVKWESGLSSITIKTLLKQWVFIDPNLDWQIERDASGNPVRAWV